MRHSYIDKYSELDSFIHRLDPRLKIIASFSLVLFIALAPKSAYQVFLLCGSILLILILCSRIPILFIFKKSLIVLPFVVLIAIFIPFIKKDGIILFWSVVIKAYLSSLTMLLLSSSTKFPDLLKGLERLKLSHIFVMLLSFMYRYSFVLVDELQRIERARKSRSFGRKNKLAEIRVLSNIVGVLFLSSYERGERVYLAMCSRGFRGGTYNPDKKS